MHRPGHWVAVVVEPSTNRDIIQIANSMGPADDDDDVR
jgi:hypothetical protein